MAENRAHSEAVKTDSPPENPVMRPDLAELEVRVRVAELRVREIEAEIRLLKAMEQRRELRTGTKRDRKKSKRREREGQAGGIKITEAASAE